MIEIKFHSDAGHGWYEVPISLIKELKLTKKITHFSYKKGNSAYLEEDLDASTLIDELNKREMEYNIIELPHVDNSPIRNYSSFK